MQKSLKERALATVLATTIVLGVAILWHSLITMPLEPQWKDWIPYPSLVDYYSIYSLITFFTSGALLFASGFYRWLYRAVGGGEDYKAIKGLIWACLVGITVAVVYAIIWTLNLLLNLAYSGLIVGLMLLPLAMATVFLMVIARATTSKQLGVQREG